MFGLDDLIAGLAGGDGVVVALVVALLLGLRHATDPDHLTAVSALVLSEDERGPRRAGLLGVSWGAGHAVTLFALGLPIVLFDSYLPHRVQQGLEVAIGALIVALGVRLLIRWRRGYFHTHVHTPRAAFAIGLVHGAGGSAGVGVLLVAAVPGPAAGLAALAVLALGTATSMAAASSGFGYALARGPVIRRVESAAPVVGTLSVALGVWYAMAAFEAVPYGF